MRTRFRKSAIYAEIRERNILFNKVFATFQVTLMATVMPCLFKLCSVSEKG